MNRQTVLLGVCASIAAYRACDIIKRLRQDKVDVLVCMSNDADKFISALSLQTLSGNRVFKEMFETVSMWEPVHISLAKKADVILVAPATSHIISKIAAGLCDDILSCVIASTKAKVLFAPAMNEAMYRNKILHDNITKLKRLGYYFIGPIEGDLACQEKGMGHIADTDAIVKRVRTLLK